MSKTKTPQIGWYRYRPDQTIVWFTGGRDHDGDLVFVTVKGEAWYLEEVDIEYLPDCTGFDWTPEKWPKYYTAYNDTYAYCRRVTESDCWLIRHDRIVEGPFLWSQMNNDRNEITEAEAYALVKPQPKTRRVDVRLVCSTDDVGAIRWRFNDDPGVAGETEVKFDQTVFYVEVPE